MQLIHTPNAPTPAGHYSQAVVHDGLVYVAGQLPVDPATRAVSLGSVEEQASLTLRNLAAILEAAGSSMDRVIKCTVYVPDISIWGRLNAVYAEHFGDHRPARVVVPTRPLHHDALVEIDAIAALL